MKRDKIIRMKDYLSKILDCIFSEMSYENTKMAIMYLTDFFDNETVLLTVGNDGLYTSHFSHEYKYDIDKLGHIGMHYIIYRNKEAIVNRLDYKVAKNFKILMSIYEKFLDIKNEYNNFDELEIEIYRDLKEYLYDYMIFAEL